MIAFFYGDSYVGEIGGHPDDIPAAQQKFLQLLRVVEPSDPTNKRARILMASEAKVICGKSVFDIPYDASLNALWRAEREERSRRFAQH